MNDRVGEEFDALIISTAQFGFFVELSELFIEGLVPIETLPGDRYSLSRKRPQDHRRAQPQSHSPSATKCVCVWIGRTASNGN